MESKRLRQQYPFEVGYYQLGGGKDDRDLGFCSKSLFSGEIVKILKLSTLLYLTDKEIYIYIYIYKFIV